MGILHRIINRLKPEPVKTMLTSFSDNNLYPSFCQKASKDDAVFSSFRSNPIHDGIVDVVDEELGKLLLQEIKLTPEVLKEIENFKQNDLYGSPRVYSYPEIGLISPATIRYIKIVYELQRLFGDLDNLNIVELGIGYGGQARIISEKFNVGSYTLIDLEEVLSLSSKYLSNFNTKDVFQYLSIANLSEKQYDLFISNYAFTELRRNIQEEYLNKVILKSKKGYILYNDINPEDFNSYKKEELLKLIPTAKILPETPLTSPKNCLIVWGVD